MEKKMETIIFKHQSQKGQASEDYSEPPNPTKYYSTFLFLLMVFAGFSSSRT